MSMQPFIDEERRRDIYRREKEGGGKKQGERRRKREKTQGGKEGGKPRKRGENFEDERRRRGSNRANDEERERRHKEERRGGRDRRLLVLHFSTYFQGDEGGGQGGHDLVCSKGEVYVCMCAETRWIESCASVRVAVFLDPSPKLIQRGGNKSRTESFPTQLYALSLPSHPITPPSIHPSIPLISYQRRRRGQSGKQQGPGQPPQRAGQASCWWRPCGQR